MTVHAFHCGDHRSAGPTNVLHTVNEPGQPRIQTAPMVGDGSIAQLKSATKFCSQTADPVVDNSSHLVPVSLAATGCGVTILVLPGLLIDHLRTVGGEIVESLAGTPDLFVRFFEESPCPDSLTLQDADGPYLEIVA